MTADGIVVTGIGVRCAIASDADAFADALRAGRDGIVPIARLDAAVLGAKVAGEILDFVPTTVPGREGRPELGRGEELAITAVAEAIAHAHLDLDAVGRDRVGLAVGTCQACIEDITNALEHPGSPIHLAPIADAVANIFGIRGCRLTPSNACSAGGAAIAMARDQLLRGRIDVAIAGGADALAYFTLAGFTSLQSLDPLGCAPYSRSGGLTVGEGAGMLVLERRSHAEARGAPILVELLGCALSADAYHPTAPDPSGRGAALAMRRALAQSAVDPDRVDYVNGHGTGTPANDTMERRAFRSVFGGHLDATPVSSTKSMTGHTLGAAGAIEAIACVLAIRDGFVPPTIRFPETDGPPAAGELDFVPNHSRPATVAVAVSNNYAFGGSNSSVVLAAPGAVPPLAAEAQATLRPVVVTGLGAVGGLGVGLDEWRDALRAGRTAITASDDPTVPYLTAACPPLGTRRFAASGAWRKMDEFARMCVASARLGWDDAALDLGPRDLDGVAVLFASQAGSLSSVLEFSRQAAARQDIDPHLFPHTAANAASGHICSILGVHGPNLSVAAGPIGGLQALDFAVGLIGRGEIDVAVVTAADQIVGSLLQHLGDLRGYVATESGEVADLDHGGHFSRTTVRPFDQDADGMALGSAGVTIVLESESHAAARGARAYARLSGIGVVGCESGTYDGRPEAWVTAMRQALAAADVDPAAVDHCLAAAPGRPAADAAELEALAEVLSPSCRVTAHKSLTGECFAADAAVGVVLACLAIEEGILAPTLGLQRPRAAGIEVGHVREPVVDGSVGIAVVNSFSTAGSYGSLVLEAPR